MQVTARRLTPRVATSCLHAPLANQSVRLYSNHSNQLQRHDREAGRRDVGNRRDWNDPFGTWLGAWEPFNFPDTFGSRFFREMDRELSKDSWAPRSSITETKEGDVLITAEMPGLAKEDISLDLDKGVLTIKGSKKEETKDDKSNVVSHKRRSFFRSFTVPEDIDPAQIKAKMEHGILEVTIPKPKEIEKKTTSIAIE